MSTIDVLETPKPVEDSTDDELGSGSIEGEAGYEADVESDSESNPENVAEQVQENIKLAGEEAVDGWSPDGTSEAEKEQVADIDREIGELVQGSQQKIFDIMASRDFGVVDLKSDGNVETSDSLSAEDLKAKQQDILDNWGKEDKKDYSDNEHQQKMAWEAVYQSVPEDIKEQVDAKRKEWATLDGQDGDYQAGSDQWRLQTGEALKQVLDSQTINKGVEAEQPEFENIISNIRVGDVIVGNNGTRREVLEVKRGADFPGGGLIRVERIAEGEPTEQQEFDFETINSQERKIDHIEPKAGVATGEGAEPALDEPEAKPAVDAEGGDLSVTAQASEPVDDSAVVEGATDDVEGDVEPEADKDDELTTAEVDAAGKETAVDGEDGESEVEIDELMELADVVNEEYKPKAGAEELRENLADVVKKKNKPKAGALEELAATVDEIDKDEEVVDMAVDDKEIKAAAETNESPAEVLAKRKKTLYDEKVKLFQDLQKRYQKSQEELEKATDKKNKFEKEVKTAIDEQGGDLPSIISQTIDTERIRLNLKINVEANKSKDLLSKKEQEGELLKSISKELDNVVDKFINDVKEKLVLLNEELAELVKNREELQNIVDKYEGDHRIDLSDKLEKTRQDLAATEFDFQKQMVKEDVAKISRDMETGDQSLASFKVELANINQTITVKQYYLKYWHAKIDKMESYLISEGAINQDMADASE